MTTCNVKEVTRSDKPGDSYEVAYKFQHILESWPVALVLQLVN